MNTPLKFIAQAEQEFTFFVKQQQLTELQAQQCKLYIQLLIEWNKKFNLTTITDVSQIIAYHFLDSVSIRNYIDFTSVSATADVGTGGGFPGLPLKILYPHLHVYLIEVNQKKIIFLQEVVDRLGLTNVEMINLDWRTFLRKTDYAIDLFCARASLAPEELIRIFKPGPYQDAQLVYWASGDWQPQSKEQPFLVKEFAYSIKSKQRKYVLFKNK